MDAGATGQRISLLPDCTGPRVYKDLILIMSHLFPTFLLTLFLGSYYACY